MAAQESPREYLARKIREERDEYQRRAARPATCSHDQRVIVWSLEFVSAADTALRALESE